MSEQTSENLQSKLRKAENKLARQTDDIENLKRELLQLRETQSLFRAKLQQEHELEVTKLLKKIKSVERARDREKSRNARLAQANRDLRTAKTPDELHAIAQALTIQNYKSFATATIHLIKQWTGFAEKNQAVYRTQNPYRAQNYNVVRGIIEKHSDQTIWFVADNFKTTDIVSDKKLTNGDSYDVIATQRQDKPIRVYVVNRIRDQVPAKPRKDDATPKSKPKQDPVKVKPAEPEIPSVTGKNIAYVSGEKNTSLARKIQDSGGTFNRIDPNERSLSQVNLAVQSDLYDYVFVDTGHSPHSTFWNARDFIKTSDNAKRINMFEHMPNPILIEQMTEYFNDNND